MHLNPSLFCVIRNCFEFVSCNFFLVIFPKHFKDAIGLLSLMGDSVFFFFFLLLCQTHYVKRQRYFVQDGCFKPRSVLRGPQTNA